MTGFDYTPLFRSTIGFDRLTRLMDAALQSEAGNAGYPPYNIEKLDENDYRVVLAVAGFAADNLSITAEANTLTIRGAQPRDGDGSFLHRGIAARSFERRFQLADHIQVTGAHLADGILTVTLHREIPEALKPRQITIERAAEVRGLEAPVVEGKPAKAA